jgi:hypothetical protein
MPLQNIQGVLANMWGFGGAGTSVALSSAVSGSSPTNQERAEEAPAMLVLMPQIVLALEPPQKPAPATSPFWPE